MKYFSIGYYANCPFCHSFEGPRWVFSEKKLSASLTIVLVLSASTSPNGMQIVLICTEDSLWLYK